MQTFYRQKGAPLYTSRATNRKKAAGKFNKLAGGMLLFNHLPSTIQSLVDLLS